MDTEEILIRRLTYVNLSNIRNSMERKYTKKSLSIPELAGFLGVSRIAIFKRVKKGDINAEKIGGRYIIPYLEVKKILEEKIGRKEKDLLERVVKRAVKEYGETLKMLSRE